MPKSYTTISAPAVTNLNSLASAAYWASPDFDNDTNLAYEVEVFVTILTTTTAGTTGSCDIYIAGSVDGGTDYAGDVTGADAAWVPVGDEVSELVFLGSMAYTAETTARTQKQRFSIDDVPKNFKLVILNNTGATLGATTCAVEWNAIKYT